MTATGSTTRRYVCIASLITQLKIRRIINDRSEVLATSNLCLKVFHSKGTTLPRKVPSPNRGFGSSFEKEKKRKHVGLCRFGRAGSVGSGRGVTIYTLDSGIRRSHQEFQPWQGSMQRVSLG